MAIGTTAALVATLVVSAISTGVAVHGQRQQAKAAENASKFNAKALENEAIGKEMESREQARRTRIQGRRLKGAQRARIAKAGIPEAGTPLELMAETATNIELSISDQRRASAIAQDKLRGAAGLELFLGSEEAKAANIGAGATLLSGASRISGKALSARKTKK